MLKRFFALTGLTLLLAGATSMPASAASFDPFKSVDCSTVADSAVCENKSGTENPVTGTIQRVVTIIAAIAGVVAIIMIIVAGISYILSGGEPAKIIAARNAIIYAVIGLIVIVLARTIIVFIVNRL